MFDDDEDDGDTPVDIFSRDNQRTNQEEMDRLMQPCLDYDDDDEADEQDIGGLLRPTLGAAKNALAADDGEGNGQQYDIEKYFSNGDVDRSGSNMQDVYGRRAGSGAGRMRRYSDDNDDPIGASTVNPKENSVKYQRIKPESFSSDEEEDDELERGSDDPLSLEELDGWMN